MHSTRELLSQAVEALGGARRPGQEKMAEAVTQALEKERHLAVQAGTGTGKSLAYLIPAIRHAKGTDSAVVVSTATIALQNQLIDRDLPRLAEALEDAPTFAIMKGRSNYVCLNKVAAAELDPTTARIADWAQETETGDRDDLSPGVSDDTWRKVSVTARECLGASRCPHGAECFAEAARRQAKEVDIVVTNHALLAIDALADIDILPEHDAVIIDEAHELDGRITSVATNTISARVITLAANRAIKLGGDERLEGAAAGLTETLAELPEGRITALDETTTATLTGLRDDLWSTRETISRAPDGEAAHDPEKAAERVNLANHLEELHDAVVRILESSTRDVVWLTDGALYVAPLAIADLLRDNLFGNKTVVLTSATLTIGGRFDILAASWGMPDGTWDALDAGTPFEPKKSGILYTATHLPAPGRDGLAPATLDEIEELITAAGGRTLGLFSSRRAATQAAEAMRERLDIDILLQGEDSTGALVEKFAAEEETCLFGTLGLWQGVDVPGSALSLVLIDRIPFPRPDDPLLQARSEAADEAGRSGFMEVSATHAALLLAQGAGRLLRSVTDRGVVAMLDNRLRTKRYGSFLRASMPNFWETTDPAVVRGALTRLAQQHT